jgi:phenylacetate-CoA ligase
MAIHAFLLLQKLRKTLKLPKAAIEEIQRKKLKLLVNHAYENVPYYRKLFNSSGIEPADIENMEDLAKIPTTGKLQLQNLPLEEILARNVDVNRCLSDVTSGSTGIPLRVYFTPEDYLYRSLIFIRTFMETGYRLTHRQAIVCDTRFVNNRKYWFQRIGVFRKKYIPVQIDLQQQIEMLREYNPHYIHGYPRSLELIAQEMQKRGIDSLSPVMVCTGAELVSKRTKETINAAFGVRMVDTYASIETGLMAWQCEIGKGYHINSDSVVLELLQKGRPSMPEERGRVVVTNLHSYAMPIIRYELGDICSFSDNICPCGREIPLMAIIEGRIDDLIHTPSGKILSPNSITNTMEAIAGISQFRVVQEKESQLYVQLVQGKGFSEEVPQNVKRLLTELVGDGIEIEVEIVKGIAREYSGKIRAVISKMSKRS